MKSKPEQPAPLVADDYASPSADRLELYERIAWVSEEMAFLSSLMVKHNGKNKKKLIKHAAELLGASVTLRGWGLVIEEEMKDQAP